MSSRPYRSSRIDELEQLVRAQPGDQAVLLAVRDELLHRTTAKATALLAQVEGKLESRDATDTTTEGFDADATPQHPTLEPVTTEDTTGEEIEGLGEAEDTAWANYPLDTLLIRNESRTVFDIVRRIKQGSFVMDPEFQRDFIWPVEKQSKLIESVLMRIPLPVFYLAEDEQGHMIVVDGLQRLSTFERFFKNELRLKLSGQDTLDRKRFDDLSPKLKNRIEDCNLILYIIDAKVPERARLDIFERVNGGVPLTRQQMRNSLYMGPGTRFLKEEAATTIFGEATGWSLKQKTMRDREFVNRFCAFQLLGADEYRGDMDDYLAASLRTMNRSTPQQLTQLASVFRASLANNLSVFGKHAFRKHAPGQTARSVLNASLWDVMITGMASLPKDTVHSQADELRMHFFRLLKDEAFNRAITYSPNSTAQVRHRFERARTMFREVFGANAG